ncbi:molybdopterin-dependent oxidoreductase [Amycolatopsis nalaikhensis]|uniref:Molybdopterin-dependent oxidoreductase n=1 Tax=Amycolatopsis nalaikhensis TaxID=715472 RepID=A0ABY8X945_9PSEU|nr:molybdopterin cofactor-binding domain-containing protein [Amycolatopsis sp. 2-2]WIV52912.1 molybdopterin-dependent oxidoreductase [Amycolatopsis sp. 2-2]
MRAGRERGVTDDRDPAFGHAGDSGVANDLDVGLLGAGDDLGDGRCKIGCRRSHFLRYKLRAALTNRCQQGAYRGFDSEVHNWVLERLVEQGAEKLGLAPKEIRRRNFILPEEFPYKIPGGNGYDSGNYPAVLDKALSMIDIGHWRKDKARLREEGRYLGIGIATTQERSAFSSTELWFWFDEPAFPITCSPESATITIDPTGSFQLLLHCQAMWGNSPETVATTVMAEETGIEPESVNVSYADTSRALPGTGPGGSRFTVMVAGAVRGVSRKLKKKLIDLAAHTLEVAPEDLELVDACVQVVGAPERSLGIADLAASAHFFALNPPPGHAERSGGEPHLRPPVHDLALTRPVRPWSLLPDHGPRLPHRGRGGRPGHRADVLPRLRRGPRRRNRGQPEEPRRARHRRLGPGPRLDAVRGARLRRGRPVQFATVLDYLVPTANEVPPFRIRHVETPSSYTEYGIKGGGEGGRTVTPSVVSAAIDDALREYGMRVTQLPVRPSDIVDLVRNTRSRTS